MESICQLKDIYKELYLFEKQFSSHNNITINEAMVLCCMKDNKPKSANDLSEFIGLSNSRVSRIINSVEKKGYITRAVGEEDKRQMIFTLTDCGRTKIEEMMAAKIELPQLITKIL